MKKNTKALLIASKETELETNAEKTMSMSHEQNGRQNYNIKIGNKSFEMVEQFKYWEQPWNKEIKSRMNSGNASYHSVQDLLSCCWLSKNIKTT